MAGLGRPRPPAGLGRVGAQRTRYHGDVLIWHLGAPKRPNAPAVSLARKGENGYLSG